MPLYQHASGEKVRTVAESPEDDRLREDSAWSPVEDGVQSTTRAAGEPEQRPAKSAAARGAVAATGGEGK